MSYKGFTKVQMRSPKKSRFDLTHKKRMSVKAGKLFPIMMTECLPGDSFRGSTDVLLRLAPLKAPIYDTLRLFVHFFFVPNRLLWEEWETFITGGRLGVGIDPVNAPVPPWIDIGSTMENLSDPFAKGTLPDYLGVPILPVAPAIPTDYGTRRLDILPFLAYQLVWYEYYRDRNYIDDDVFDFPYPSGEANPVTDGFLILRDRDYLKEYFTSALPFTQRGVEVLMPLAGTGTVTYSDASRVYLGDGGNTPASTTPALSTDVDGDLFGDPGGVEPAQKLQLRNIEEVQLTASSVSINDFRAAYALQVWYERNAVAGSRYTESIKAHFDVDSGDARLQRPEFLGGGRIPVKITEVVTTAFSQDEEGATIPAANLQGHGVVYGNTNKFAYFCREHGFIIGIGSIMYEPSYHQGLSKMWRRRSFLDYPWPVFATLGEQQVDKIELYCDPLNFVPNADGTLPLFGYQSRYSEWKYIPDTSHGDFHDVLLFWTFLRDFSDTPILGEQFVKCNGTEADRIFAVQGEDQFWLYVLNNLNVVRALPYFGVPNTLGFQ